MEIMEIMEIQRIATSYIAYYLANCGNRILSSDLYEPFFQNG